MIFPNLTKKNTMKPKHYLFLLTLGCYISSFAGNYSVTITVKGLPSSMILLTNFLGDKNEIIDSVKCDTYGKATFMFPASRHTGMYKIVCGDDKFIDFIFNKENIIFESHINDIQSNLKVIESKENQIYFEFLKTYKLIKEKLNALQQLSQYYDQSDPFTKQFTQEYYNKIKDITNLQETIKKENPNSYAYKLIKAKTEIFPEIGGSQFLVSAYLRSHWFDNIDFRDTSLFYSNAFTTKAISYLQLYASKFYNHDQQIRVFKSAIDTLLERSKVNKKTYNFMVDYLINGFEEMGNNILVEHVANSYSNDNACDHDGSKSTLERKVLSYTKLKIGIDAPFFEAITESGSKISLDNYANNTLIVVFWATWCPHCRETLPEIKKLFDNRIDKKSDLLTISLDTNKTEWRNYIKLNGFNNTINICDGKSWDGKIASDYNAYSTPTIFIIKNKKIIGKPLDLETFKEILQSENIIKQ